MATPKAASGGQFDLTRYVHFIFIFGGAIAIYLLYNIIHYVWIRFDRFPNFPVLAALAVIGGGGLAVYLWRQERVNELARETVNELSRVTWPTRPELGAATVVVIVTSIVMAIILGLFDAFWSWVTTLIY
jgi:preprotein translocase SecE subunit